MIRFIRDLRLVPIALIASACLLALKTADLVFEGGYLIAADNAPTDAADASVVRTAPGVPQVGGPPRSWAQEMFNFPDSNGEAQPASPAPLVAIATPPVDRASADITGSVTERTGDKGKPQADDEVVGALGNEGDAGKEAKESKEGKAESKEGKAAKDAKPLDGTAIPTEAAPVSGSERAILERLQERRQELDKRSRELDIREGLLQAAEKRVEARLAELKDVEARIVVATEKRDEAEAARFKGLVTMYENMKPREAAKIFDRLEIGVLLEVGSLINPRRMADILAQMSPETAERLTVELASRARMAEKGSGAELPKIEGRPTSP